MSTSQNGWPASPNLRTRTVVIAGATFHMVDNDDAVTVLSYVISEYAAKVEPLRPSVCACFSYRPNRNNPSQLSNHSSATACDLDWDEHPNGVEAVHNFSAAQIKAIHAIYASVPELSDVVHWGGDWHSPLTPDPMHHELHSHDLAALARVASRIREGIDMPLNKDDLAAIKALIEAERPKVVEAVLDAPVGKDGTTLKQAVNQGRQH